MEEEKRCYERRFPSGSYDTSSHIKGIDDTISHYNKHHQIAAVPYYLFKCLDERLTHIEKLMSDKI